MPTLLAPAETPIQVAEPEAPPATRSFEWLSSMVLVELGQRVVQVGSGIGAWTALLLSRQSVIALDQHPASVARLLARFGDRANLDALTMDVASARFRELARYQPDSVLCVEALAGADDDRRALFNISTVLPAGGRVVLVEPACPALFGARDTALGHRRRYSKEGIERLAASVGLRVCQARYVNVAGFLGWWWDGVLSRVETPRPSAFRERLVPLLQAVEKLAAPPFGETVFAVLERPA